MRATRSREWWHSKPLRKARIARGLGCSVCQGGIVPGEHYFDDGNSHRAHRDCVDFAACVVVPKDSDTDGKGMSGGSYVPRDLAHDLARDFLSRMFRMEGYSYEDAESATDHYSDDLLALIDKART